MRLRDVEAFLKSGLSGMDEHNRDRALGAAQSYTRTDGGIDSHYQGRVFDKATRAAFNQFVADRTKDAA